MPSGRDEWTESSVDPRLTVSPRLEPARPINHRHVVRRCTDHRRPRFVGRLETKIMNAVVWHERIADAKLAVDRRLDEHGRGEVAIRQSLRTVDAGPSRPTRPVGREIETPIPDDRRIDLAGVRTDRCRHHFRGRPGAIHPAAAPDVGACRVAGSRGLVIAEEEQLVAIGRDGHVNGECPGLSGIQHQLGAAHSTYRPSVANGTWSASRR